MNLFRFCIQVFLDVLFPVHCKGCGIKDTFLCLPCSKNIPLLHKQFCFICTTASTTFGQICSTCKVSNTHHSLDAIYTAMSYKHPILAQSIHLLKYDCIRELATPLSHCLFQAFQVTCPPLPQAIIPIPLHSRRIRGRGFNQSHAIALALRQQHPTLSSIPLFEPLKRIIHTKPQMSILNKQQRAINIQEAFAWNEHYDNFTPSSTVWLLDDVITTGATMEACARILKQHGASKVYGIALAH